MKDPDARRVLLSQEPSGPGATARPMAKGFALLAVLLPALLACGCSTFNRDWRAAVKQPIPPDAITGRWEGAWKSDASGHTGKLRGLVSKVDETHYRASFRAAYRHILHFSYAVPLTVEQGDGVWHFSGEEDLGKLAGGVYRYEGQATPTNFFSTYRSQYDHGTFEMARPE